MTIESALSACRFHAFACYAKCYCCGESSSDMTERCLLVMLLVVAVLLLLLLLRQTADKRSKSSLELLWRMAIHLNYLFAC